MTYIAGHLSGIFFVATGALGLLFGDRRFLHRGIGQLGDLFPFGLSGLPGLATD